MLYYIRDLRTILNFKIRKLMIYNTEKRKEITALIIRNADKAFSIDEICERIAPDGKGKSTVYRIVASLVDEGELCKISDADTRRVTYRYLGGGKCHEHMHLKCKECGRLIHLDAETSFALENTILTARGFEIDVSATIFGRCKGCISGGGSI